MTNTIFPEIEFVALLNKFNASGFTDGKNIFINLYTGIFNTFNEEYIEDVINDIYIHELIHTIDMDIQEIYVIKLSNKILDNIIKNCIETNRENMNLSLRLLWK